MPAIRLRALQTPEKLVTSIAMSSRGLARAELPRREAHLAPDHQAREFLRDWFARSAVSPVTLARARKTVTRSVTAITSLSLCVMSRMVLPSARKRRKLSKRPFVSCGVRTAVGSSRMRMFASR